MPGPIATLKNLIGSLSGFLQIGIIAGLLVVTFIFTRAPSEAEIIDRGATSRGSTTDVAQSVSVIMPVAESATPTIRATGTVRVRSYVNLSSQVGGRVTSVSDALRAGGAFLPGQELLRIDPKDFQLNLDQARSDVASAEATLKLREAEGDAAIENYALLNPGKSVPTLVAKVPQIDQAKAQLAAARARQQIAALALERTSFSLPFPGRITETSIELGQLLSAGQTFGRAFSEDGVEAMVSISSRELKLIMPAVGRQASLVADGVTVPAWIDRVAPELDGQSRFASVFLRLGDRNKVAPGTFVDAEIQGATYDNTYVIPEAARQINDTLWISDGGKLARFIPQVLATTRDGLVVSAFDYRDGIIVSSIPGAREGLAVATVASQ